MNYLMIESHPYEGSFNTAAADAIENTLKAGGHSLVRRNLVTDGFNPVMTAEDLNAWRQGKTVDPLVTEYQKAISKADVLIFPFPIWWGAMPAVLKGFCDKVLLPGGAYRYGEQGEMIGILDTKKAVVLTTMEMTNDFYENQLRNPVRGAFIQDTLQSCGIETEKYFCIDRIVSGEREYKEAVLRDITSYFSA